MRLMARAGLPGHTGLMGQAGLPSPAMRKMMVRAESGAIAAITKRARTATSAGITASAGITEIARRAAIMILAAMMNLAERARIVGVVAFTPRMARAAPGMHDAVQALAKAAMHAAHMNAAANGVRRSARL